MESWSKVGTVNYPVLIVEVQSPVYRPKLGLEKFSKSIDRSLLSRTLVSQTLVSRSTVYLTSCIEKGGYRVHIGSIWGIDLRTCLSLMPSIYNPALTSIAVNCSVPSRLPSENWNPRSCFCRGLLRRAAPTWPPGLQMQLGEPFLSSPPVCLGGERGKKY